MQDPFYDPESEFPDYTLDELFEMDYVKYDDDLDQLLITASGYHAIGITLQ